MGIGRPQAVVGQPGGAEERRDHQQQRRHEKEQRVPPRFNEQRPGGHEQKAERGQFVHHGKRRGETGQHEPVPVALFIAPHSHHRQHGDRRAGGRR